MKNFLKITAIVFVFAFAGLVAGCEEELTAESQLNSNSNVKACASAQTCQKSSEAKLASCSSAIKTCPFTAKKCDKTAKNCQEKCLENCKKDCCTQKDANCTKTCAQKCEKSCCGK